MCVCVCEYECGHDPLHAYMSGLVSANDLCLCIILIMHVMVWRSVCLITAGFICVCLLKETDTGGLLTGPVSGKTTGSESFSGNSDLTSLEYSLMYLCVRICSYSSIKLLAYHRMSSARCSTEHGVRQGCKDVHTS